MKIFALLTACIAFLFPAYAADMVTQEIYFEDARLEQASSTLFRALLQCAFFSAKLA